MKTQVAVVGGGPVGLGLAIELGQRGVDVFVLERTAEIHQIPKGQNLTQRSMEHFRSWGVEAGIRRARLMPPNYPAVGINAYGNLASEYAHPWFRRSQVDRYYFASNERLPQYLTEQVLRDRVGELSDVTTLYGAAVSHLDHRSDHVVVSTGEGRSVEAEYAIGCDGSHSTVREAAGISETRSDHDRKMVLMAFRSRDLHEILEDQFGEAAFFNVLDPDLDGYWRFLGRVDVGERWFFHAPVDPDSEVDYETLVHDTVGVRFPIDVDYIGFWNLRIAVADTYGKGRVFIAGDAAHSHPPYGGYGINTGLEDARNLGWKLAATLAGWGSERLLDSYTEERRPVFISTARDFIEAFIENDREFIARHDPGRDLSDFAAAWEKRRSGSNLAVSEFEPHYSGSPIISGATGESGAIGKHTFQPRAGHHLPPPKEARGDLFAALASGFTLLATPGPGVEAFVESARSLRVPLDVVATTQRTDTAAYGASVLVRPDHFVAWVGDLTSVNPTAVLATAVGVNV